MRRVWGRGVFIVVDAVVVPLFVGGLVLVRVCLSRWWHAACGQAQCHFALLVDGTFVVHLVWVVAALSDDAGATAETVVDFHRFALHVLDGVDVGPAVRCVFDAAGVVRLVNSDFAGQHCGLDKPVHHALAELRDDRLPLALFGKSAKVVDQNPQGAVTDFAYVP